MESSDFIPGASEIGSLTAHSNEESQFVGSSSGVFFINTVRQAFSKNLTPSSNGPSSSAQDFPHPEDTIVGSEDSPRGGKQHHAPSTRASPSMTGDSESLGRWGYDPDVAAALGYAPPVEMAKEFMMVYFKIWHPLFPFLHGPTFLQAMELLYSSEPQNKNKPESSSNHRNACWTTIFQCVFNLASLLRPDIQLPVESRIESPSSMHSLLATLSFKHDIPSLQALLAAQLYQVAKMSLRTASTFGGCTLRSMLHGGFHRCPFRYKELSSHDRQLRKRVFWCAYAIDRYLSQALGLPLGIQDSDIDVCTPGACEVHTQQAYSAQVLKTGSYAFSQSREPSTGETPVRDDGMTPPTETQQKRHDNVAQGTEEQRKREATLASYVESGKLTGRALELFHKSIMVRSIRRSSVLFLVTDVHKWWNGLPPELQGSPNKLEGNATAAIINKPFEFGPFFTILYQHMILLINRPSLSLNPSSAEFCSGLQTCIGAARGILTALGAQVDGGQALFWPGFLSAAWMSGLVLAFACQLKQYVLSKGSQELNECLRFLHIMSAQWEPARHCHKALTLLSSNIRQPTNDTTTETPQSPSTQNHNAARPRKRKLNANEPLNPHDPFAVIPDTHIPPNTNNHEVPLDTTILPTPTNLEPIISTYANTQQTSPSNSQDLENRLFLDGGFSGSTMTPANLDLNMVDLLQGANFDTLFDMFGQQYPSF
ncbi:hypothetical protein ASPWEDRAFT_169385 [Aspergillus wentii DTO 134E9]|uniref:Xylanolytic transcriptional activator regulatory domain-containing protein n=1 Tax=Aspergillus wentii DTO 134E9 TaxID=1073089 RepID=A0A1L9RXB9_ASPWE|nr:uncharacterized protein ASPWEDRAFT_169385 [Aspergillus wentii DTO 134E9]KAI9931774.1 hypothetical protein MW887_010353 [Aspergillus wentii]OJJ39543.1 hypothetical protein ASPWEDRAFT_169385 [Aspergillus wentii DTO 134E9]